MQEDELGTRKTVFGDRYTSCTRCGQPIVPAEATALHVPGEGPAVIPDVAGTLRPFEATQEGPPPRLCPACTRDILAGEPLELLDQQEPPEPGASGLR